MSESRRNCSPQAGEEFYLPLSQNPGVKGNPQSKPSRPVSSSPTNLYEILTSGRDPALLPPSILPSGIEMKCEPLVTNTPKK